MQTEYDDAGFMIIQSVEIEGEVSKEIQEAKADKSIMWLD